METPRTPLLKKVKEQELQSLYTSEEIEMVIRLLRGGPGITTPEQIRKNAAKGSKAREFWDKRQDDMSVIAARLLRTE